MKKTSIFIVLLILMGGIRVAAQRPVGDTIVYGSNEDYLLYDPVHDVNCAYEPLRGYFCSDTTHIYSCGIDPAWYFYYCQFLLPYFFRQCNNSLDDLSHAYPDLFNINTGRHITGLEYPTLNGNIAIIGMACCPTLVNTENMLIGVTVGNPLPDGASLKKCVIDTSMANRDTEYLQLYAIEGGQPQLLAEGGWRFDDPHRNMIFPYTVRGWWNDAMTTANDSLAVPLYEVMFDSTILIDHEKSPTIMIAGTHNNNGMMWSLTANDTVFPTPRNCWLHYPTAYSYRYNSYIMNDSTVLSYWCKYDTMPWYNYAHNPHISDYRFIFFPNIFPILDTLFGTPCAEVSNLQAVEVDTLWATLMWSADARHQEWEVKYRPMDDSLASDSVVTVSVPTVTLTGLTPGTAYSVRVRGLCDIENYSPWCDTLLFTTPQDTVADTLPYITPFHPLSIGNLDRYTHIMPNPAHDMVSILSSYQLQGVAVYDLTGRQMLKQPADGMTATVNVSALPRGTYILAICTLQGVATKRLILK